MASGCRQSRSMRSPHHLVVRCRMPEPAVPGRWAWTWTRAAYGKRSSSCLLLCILLKNWKKILAWCMCERGTSLLTCNTQKCDIRRATDAARRMENVRRRSYLDREERVTDWFPEIEPKRLQATQADRRKSRSREPHRSSMRQIAISTIPMNSAFADYA